MIFPPRLYNLQKNDTFTLQIRFSNKKRHYGAKYGFGTVIGHYLNVSTIFSESDQYCEKRKITFVNFSVVGQFFDAYSIALVR